MKRNKVTCFTSLSLAVLLTVSSLSGSVVNVFATGTDDSIQVTTESQTGDEIVIEKESENDIVISDSDKSDEIVVENNKDAISVTESESENVVIDDVEDVCSSSVSLIKDEDEIVIEQEHSVVGDMVSLYVKAENTSDKEMEFQLSFWSDVEDVEAIKAEVLKTIATDMTFEEFKEKDSMPIDLKSGDKTVEAKATLVKEQKDDTLTKCYISVKMPAKTILDTEFHVSSDVAQTVTVVPCMAESYGKAVNITWTDKKADDEIAIESETESETEPEIIVEEENVEDSFASVYLGDNQVDTSSLNASDFASMRLVLLTEDKTVIPNEADILAQYDNIYLLHFTSIQQTMNAYTYFKNLSLSVEPDMPVEAAGEKEKSLKDTDEIIVSKDALMVSETENPIDTLNNIMSDTADSEEITVSQDGNVIALIDTGVGESTNVIDRVSVIEEPEASTEHGDAMLKFIVSQNPDAKVLSIRAMNSNGFGTISSLVAAMEYAISENVDMINLSLYARTTLSTSVLKSEIQKAVDAGITVIGAAGNDGVDVVDYVPGSVESAYIIGAAKEDGSRLETSNFGKTVDYNVVGKSTSEATALFTGYVSKNGLDSVASVLNQGLIFETGFGGEEYPDKEDIVDSDVLDNVVITEERDYLEDVGKTFAVKYKLLDSTKVKSDLTIDEVMDGDRDEVYIDMDANLPVYKSNVDGKYLIFTDTMYRNGLATGSVMDIVFTRANYNGEVLTEGIAYDYEKNVIVVEESVFKDAHSGDYADVQAQLMLPVDVNGGVKNINMSVHNDDKLVNVSVKGNLTNERPLFPPEIQLVTEGTANNIKQSNIGVYINGSKTPLPYDAYAYEPDTGKFSVYLSSAMISDMEIDIEVNDVVMPASDAHTGHKVDSLKRLCYVKADAATIMKASPYTTHATFGQNGYPGFPRSTVKELWNKGLSYFHYPTGANGAEFDGAMNAMQIGIPKNAFGVDFAFRDANGNPYASFKREGTTGYNSPGEGFDYSVINQPVRGGCHHASTALGKPGNEYINGYPEVKMRVADSKSSDDGYTDLIISVETTWWAYGGSSPQTVGSVFRVGASGEQKVPLSASKTWDDQNNKYQTRPSRLGFQLLRRSKLKGESTWSNWTEYESVKYATAPNWTVNFGEQIIKDKNGNEFQYRVKELVPDNYRVDGNDTKDFSNNKASFKNILNNGYLKIVKKSDNPEMTDNNSCYDLAGAEFEVYTDAACTKKANYSGGPIVTERVNHADGTSTYETRVVELVVGTYYVKETKPPKGFEIIEEGQPFKVDITVGHRKDQPFTLSVVNHAENDPLVITIDKIWNGEETPTIPSLAGTQFTVWYYDNFNKDVSGTPKKTWVLEVKQRPNGTWRCGLQDEYLVKEKSDDFYRDTDTKKPILPYGTYKIQETKHAPGYTFEGTWGNKDGSVSMSTTEPYITVVDKNTTGGINLWGGNEYTGQNKPHDTLIKIRKVDENGRPLAGVKFTLKNSKGELVSTKTSGSDGYVTWDKLYPDIYTVTEIETVDGKNLLADDIEIYLPMRITEEDIKKYNIDRNKLSEWDKAEQCYYLFDVTYEISNSATFKVPSTGGFADFMTFLPLIGGMAGLTGVGAITMKKKRKREE